MNAHVQAPIELNLEQSNDRMTAVTDDIGMLGCFVKSAFSFPIGSIVRLRINEQSRLFSAMGEVAYILTGEGMWIRFCEMTTEDCAQLEEILAKQNNPQNATLRAS